MQNTKTSFLTTLGTVLITLAGFVLLCVIIGKFLSFIPWSWTWILWTLTLRFWVIMVFGATLVIYSTKKYILSIPVITLSFFFLLSYFTFGTLMLMHAEQEEILRSSKSIQTKAVVTGATFLGFVNHQGEFDITLSVSDASTTPFSSTIRILGDGSSERPPYPVGGTAIIKYDPTTHHAAFVTPLP